MNRNSGAARRQLTGIAIAPRWLAAKIVARNSRLLYDSNPTTSPAPTPRWCSPAATDPAHSSIPRKVTTSSPNTARGLSGARRAWCSNTPNQLMSGCISGTPYGAA